MLCINLGWRAEPFLLFPQQLCQRKICESEPQVPANTLSSKHISHGTWARPGVNEALWITLLTPIFSLRPGVPSQAQQSLSFHNWRQSLKCKYLQLHNISASGGTSEFCSKQFYYRSFPVCGLWEGRKPGRARGTRRDVAMVKAKSTMQEWKSLTISQSKSEMGP